MGQHGSTRESSPYSSTVGPSTVSRLAPVVFRITLSYLRACLGAAIAPISTAIPARMATDAAATIALDIWPRSSPTWLTISPTATTETPGKVRSRACVTGASRSGGMVMVAEAVRSAGQRVRREDQHIVEAHRVPVDFAQRGDARFDLAPQHAHGQRVADADIQNPGRLLVQRDQRRPAIVAWPPPARHQIAAFRQGVAIGHPAFAAQEPCAVRNLFQIRDALPPIGDDGTAQARHDVEFGVARVLTDEIG